ncbi:hypothetical protein PABG_11656 [Paracoccidioides brasiliensis Pb03]|nr:hypothetical protein PABG_11656 [Paracoccidioides brasiliensis Pb03]
MQTGDSSIVERSLHQNKGAEEAEPSSRVLWQLDQPLSGPLILIDMRALNADEACIDSSSLWMLYRTSSALKTVTRCNIYCVLSKSQLNRQWEIYRLRNTNARGTLSFFVTETKGARSLYRNGHIRPFPSFSKIFSHGVCPSDHQTQSHPVSDLSLDHHENFSRYTNGRWLWIEE